MRTDIEFMYDENRKDYVVHGYPELEGRHGTGIGDGMVIFSVADGGTMSFILPIL